MCTQVRVGSLLGMEKPFVKIFIMEVNSEIGDEISNLWRFYNMIDIITHKYAKLFLS